MILARITFVAVMLCLWFWTQKLIAARGFVGTGIGDKIHQWTERWHLRLRNDDRRAKRLLIVSSFAIDLLGIYMLTSAIFGSSITPFVGLVILFALRQLMQFLTALPAPDGMIWIHPGCPSLLVTYGTSNDLFFSGHTAVAVYGGLQLIHTGVPALALLGIAVAVFEIAAVLILRAHWTMDVYSGLVTALLVDIAALKLGPWIDACLNS